MLIVERGIDEGFIIDDMIVRVVAIDGNSIRLAVASPNGQPRYREVTLQIPSNDADVPSCAARSARSD